MNKTATSKNITVKKLIIKNIGKNNEVKIVAKQNNNKIYRG